MLTFIIGLMVGGIIGFFVMCLLAAGKDSDRCIEEWGHFTDAQQAVPDKGDLKED